MVWHYHITKNFIAILFFKVIKPFINQVYVFVFGKYLSPTQNCESDEINLVGDEYLSLIAILSA